MTPAHVNELKPQLPGFAAWLAAQGGEVAEPTNGYEVLRVRGGGKVHVLYQKGTGQLTWPDPLREAFAAFRSGARWTGFTRVYGRGYKARAVREQLRRRDGDDCFYCGRPVGADEGSVEHLVNRADGGPNTLANMVLAHEPCNQEAGDRPLIEKIKLRDRMRAQRGTDG